MASKMALMLVVLAAVVLVCSAGVPQKREVKEGEIKSDAQQAMDKLFDDLSTGIKKLAEDGINLDGIKAKAEEVGEQLQKLGKELGDKVQEAAKKQGLTE